MSQNNNSKKNTAKLPLGRVGIVFMLLVLLVVGLVSTTFASFVADNSSPEDGSLIARVQTAVTNRSKEDIADTKADANVAQTGANLSKGDVIWYTGSKTHIYVWESSSETSAAAWPGEALKTDATSGMKYWISDSDTPFDMCIFSNNGSDQTADLAIGGAGYVHNSSGSTGVYYSNEVSTDNIKFDLLPILKGESIMFYIGEPSSWNQSTFYLRSGAGGSTVDSGSYVITYSNNRYAVVTAPSKTGYYVSHSTSWDGEKLNSAPKSGVAYLCNNNDSTSGCATSGSQYTVSATLAKTSISVGNTVTISNSSKSSGNLGRTTSIEYYVKDANGGFKKLSYSGTTLDTSGLEAGSYTIYPVLFDGYVYTRGTGISFTVNSKYSYTVTSAYGGSVTPTSGEVEIGDSVSIKATANSGYTFAEWAGLSKATIGSATSASTTLKPTADGATVKAYFRPNTPSALTLTGSNVASGTTGDGTENNPYIVFDDGGFTITANATVTTGTTKYYCDTENGTYKTANTFTPSLSTKGTSQMYTVYAKGYVTGYYSLDPKSATAYYMVFSHLNGANTSFDLLPDTITDADTLTLSGAKIEGVADAEKEYITHTYQVSTNNSTFSDISDTTWNPNSTGTYYFRVKTTNTKTGETVYSTSQSVTVTQSTVYYDITVTNDGSVAGTVKLYADGVEITDGKILSNSELSVSIIRPNKAYYIDYLEIDTITTQDCMDVNGDIIKYVVYDHVKGDVSINYKLLAKPTAEVVKPTDASAISFKYYVDGVETTATTAGTYSVDYNSKITYAVTPNTGYYVSDMTNNVEMGPITSSTVTGTKSGVTTNLGKVNATLVANNTVTVNVDTTSVVTEGGSMTVDSTAVSFGTPKSLNYGAEAEVVITPPNGYYAVVNGVDADISTDGKATFYVMLTGSSKVYTVKFIENPKIYMVQPRYGSIYVTDGAGNYYFNGDSVGYGTELTLNVKRDHSNASIDQIIVNGENIGTEDGKTFNIIEDTTVTADILVDSKFAFSEGTEYGTRRIFFTDNASWGDGKVSVHPSTTSSSTNITTDSVVMTYKYTNDMSQRVYYADIPFSAKYVTFYNNSNTNQKTNTVAISNANNAFWNDNGTCTAWNMNYSDFVATDRADSIQQGVTVKGEAATFEYSCDFGDDTLSAEVLDGNAATVEFDKGILSIIPTANSKAFSLVKITSAASGTVKYYLVRVENFEITGFSGLQKIYNSGIFNDIQLDLIVKGGVLNFAAKLYVSDSNKSDSYSELSNNVTSTGFEYLDSIEEYINSFLIRYEINSISGVKYYKVEATDGANHKATKTLRTLFGTNTYNGERCVYFYNKTGSSISKYDVRACFNDESNTNHRFVTMQRVGSTDYYRAVVPNGYESSVNFYLTNTKTFTNDYADYDGTDDTTEAYYYGILGESIPETDDANIVYAATEFSDTEGIKGGFTTFDY